MTSSRPGEIAAVELLAQRVEGVDPAGDAGAHAPVPPPVSVLRVATYNIHKGFTAFTQQLMLRDLRVQLHTLAADVMFLQEVHGRQDRHAIRYEHWPAKPQYEFLADAVWTDFAYGKNAVYNHGHHGNAILSRYPIVKWDNVDVSAYFFESRGLLHCEIDVPGWQQRLHCVNVHLGLLARGRRWQLKALCNHIRELVPEGAPLVIAGDFNDWRKEASEDLVGALGVSEVFEVTRGHPARSFPTRMPLFRLDRIYVRGFEVRHAHVHHGRDWARLSDHAPLSATLTRS
ncbi:MAG: endonuclease/exonuclease/phosphatase family protein [Proteobacteria bacterium]|nr:endonuclease/exonuclease/phosphatase family protein [Burkholderiales bacterium]